MKIKTIIFISIIFGLTAICSIIYVIPKDKCIWIKLSSDSPNIVQEEEKEKDSITTQYQNCSFELEEIKNFGNKVTHFNYVFILFE